MTKLTIRALFMCLVLLLCFGCAAKTTPMQENNQPAPQQELVKFKIIIEGLEAVYHTTVIDSLKAMNGYSRHTTIISKDGILETSFRFVANSSKAEDISERLNALFMSMSKTAKISFSFDTFKIKITEW